MSAEAPRDCTLCPRLVAYRQANARAEPSWFNAPVPSFGEADARLLIVGLAPGVTGANRTGRPFTGDHAGMLLYGMLERFGLSEGVYAADPGDGLRLRGAMISNAVRCVPPENKPTGAEIAMCRGFLAARIAALPELRVILTLGRIAHDSTLRALGFKPQGYGFRHGGVHRVSAKGRALTLVSSYHCSRYNTSTGRLTEAMFADAFALAVGAVREAD